MKLIGKIVAFAFLLLLIPSGAIYAETLEDQLNNLIGPQQQYNTMLSPVYLRNNTTEEQISPQSGELTITQTDYVLPGRNGLDLEFKRIYKSGSSNVQDMQVKYVNGAWVDFVYSDAKTTSFYEERYNLGIGMRFSFPSMEVIENSDGTSHKFLHTESGDVYRLKAQTMNGALTYLPEGQTIKDVVVKETNEYSNGQSDGTSKYVMVGKDVKKTYFTQDGRIIGIVDRYGNTIKFEYISYTYTIDRQTLNRKLISTITDTVGRVTTIEYKEDESFTVGPATDQNIQANNTYTASQNPNPIDSGDLQGKFQVILHLPGDKKIVYDKSAMLVSPSKHVIRTRLQRVEDLDGKPKYHFWYEQPNLGFTYMNGSQYAVYNRYENLVQIDYSKTNHIKRYVYNTYTKSLSKGSMQYRKIFEKKELVKLGFDPGQSSFMDKFVTEEKDKLHYTYTNEADGFGADGYKAFDDIYLRDTYRYFSETMDMRGNTTKYSFDGVHQLLLTEKNGADHKEVLTTERDEMKLVKKQESVLYQISGGQTVGNLLKTIENYRYDEYGNLTNYTGPEAARDDSGYPIDNEHTVVYAYDYDRFHVISLKTWKKDKDTTSQIRYEIDEIGNVVKETKVNTDDAANWVVTQYQYDSYGNMTRKEASSGEQAFATQYEYGIDLNGVDHKGAYLTKEYQLLNGQEIAKKYAYDFLTGNLTIDSDANGNQTVYEYDLLGRVMKASMPDLSWKEYSYEENTYANLQISYTDPEGNVLLHQYDILGKLLQTSVMDKGQWNVLQSFEYDAKGNKTKEFDSNGNSIRYEYDSLYRLARKTAYEKDTVSKGTMQIGYALGQDAQFPLIMTITDEEGYVKRYYYDIQKRLRKVEATPDRVQTYTTAYTYDYVGNKLTETDGNNGTTRFTYDNHGRLVSKQDALGNETSLSYNALNQVSFKKEPGGKVTETLYDELGRISSVKTLEEGSASYTFTSYEYDSVGNITRMVQGQNDAGNAAVATDTSYVYDALNRLIDEFKKVDETRTAHTHHSYNRNGNRIQTIQYADAVETSYRIYEYGYEYSGKVTEEKGAYRESDSSGALVEHGSYRKQYERDYAGNVLRELSDNGQGFDTVSFSFNYRNQVIEKVEPFASGIKTTQYQYDKVGNRTAETLIIQGVPATVTTMYDGLGRVVGTLDAMGNTTRYVLDPNGNRIKQIDPRYISFPIESAPGIEFEYDALNRLVKTIAFDGSVREVIGYKEYDARGNVSKEVDGVGYNATDPSDSIGIEYKYDVNNRKTAVISAQTSADNRVNGTHIVSQSFTYDGVGNVLSVMDAEQRTTSLTYYGNGLLKEKIHPDGLSESYDYDLTGKSFIVQKDRAGWETKSYMTIFDKPYRIEYPDGSAETFTYSPKGEVIQNVDQLGHATSIEYDRSGNPIAKREWISLDGTNTLYKVTRVEYDEANRPVSNETFLFHETGDSASSSLISAGDRIEYTYDKAGKVLKTTGPSGREALKEYDRAGNVLTELKKVDGSEYDVTRFEYDFLGRLASKSLLVKTSDLSIEDLINAQYDNTYYDRVLSTTSYSYYKNGTVKSQTDPNGNTATVQYDYDSRPTKKTDAMQSTTQYNYDKVGNLVEETNVNGAVTFYEYDELNQLIRKKTSASDGSVAVNRFVLDAAGNMLKTIAPNQYDNALDLPGLVEQMGGVSYTYDSLNRRTSTISPEGQGVEYIQYDSKGQVIKVIDGLRYTDDMISSAGTTFAYNGLGQVVKKTNTLGNDAEFEYDLRGQLTSATDERGNTTRYVYNSDGTLSQVIYADSGKVRYTYDKLGRMLTETNQLGAMTAYRFNAFGQPKIVEDHYGNTIESKYDLVGNLVSQRDKRGSVTLFKYDGNRRLTEKRMPQELDESGNVVYAIESYEYDPAGNVTRKRLNDSRDKSFIRETAYTYYSNNLVKSVSDNSGSYSQSFYDRNGNLVKLEKLRESSLYDIEKYEYDIMNRMVKNIRLADKYELYDAAELDGVEELKDSEYPDKIRSITGYEYDILGNKVKEIDPRAYAYAASDTANRDTFAIIYTYDAINRLEKTIRQQDGAEVYKQLSYDEVSNKISERNERGFETTYTYDSVNRLQTITDPGGNTFSYQHDLAGNKISETNAKGDSMSYSYDELNRLVTVIDAYGAVISRYVYDENGNMTKKIDAKGYLAATEDGERYGWVYTYDLANRLVKEVDPEVVSRNDVQLFTSTYQYNTAGEKIQRTDTLGHSTQYSFDEAGKLIQVTDPLGISVSYGYDMTGNKLYMVDGRGKKTEYRFGSFGLLLETIDAVGRSTHNRFDLALNTAETVDRNGNHIRFDYDNRNLLESQSVVETGDRIDYGYDEAGNRIIMSDESGVKRYAYDVNNRLISIEKDGQIQLTYTYDVAGNIESLTDKTGFTTSYTYDKSSRMDTVTAAGRITQYQYDENGNRKSISYEGGVTEEYSFDKLNRLLELTNKKPDGSDLSSFSYTYDDAGNQTSKTDSYGTTNYAYDAAGRILKVEAPGKTTAYSYDGASNRQTLHETYTSAQPSGYTDASSSAELQYNVKKTDYMYSKANELVQLVERMLDAAGKQVLEKTTTYLYDNNGNEIRQKVSYLRPHNRDMNQVTGGNPQGEGIADDPSSLIEKVSNTFDGFNRLKQTERVKAGERVTVAYMYDGDGLRTQKTVRSSEDEYTAKVTNYLYDRQYVILETDESDQLSVRYVKGINYIARIDNTDKLSYFLYNGHGDVVQTVSESGEVENQYDYDVFGNATLTIEMYGNSIRYAGEFFDAEAGLYYLRARYYNPYIGRFISEDSYEGRDAEPLSLNRYTYVLNSPLMYWDPTGHWEEGDQDLNKEAQASLIALTTAYFNAQTDEEKVAIGKQAIDIRTSPSSKQDVVTPLNFNTNAIAAINKESDDVRGYMNKEDWDKALKNADIKSDTTTNNSYSNADNITTAEESTYANYSTTTTTTIGRTNLTVNSNYKQVLDETRTDLVGEASSSISLSYNITQNEGKFLASFSSDSQITLEQALVALDTLKSSKNGEITKDQIEAIGIEYYQGFLWFDNTESGFEAAYDLSKKGLSVSEAEIFYYQEVQSKSIQEAFGVSSLAFAGGGFRVNSAKPTENKKIEYKGAGQAASKGRSIVGTDFSEIKPTQTVVNRAKVDEYKQKLLNGEKVDPIVVYDVQGKGRFIEEGHHRFIASQETGIPVGVTVKNGSGPAGLSNWSEVEWKKYISEDQFWGD